MIDTAPTVRTETRTTMQDPDEWSAVGVHWHAYAEVRESSESFHVPDDVRSCEVR